MSRGVTPKLPWRGDLHMAIESLERRVAAEADDADARYKLAVLLLEAYSWTNERRQLSHAREELEQAVKQLPNHAPSHAVLGFVYDQSRTRGARQALACMREARRLNPRDKIYEIYLITLLQESGREKEALAAIKAAAPRHDVDLKKLLRQFAEAGMKPDAASLLTNGFIRPRNFLKSRLADEAERILNRLQPGRAQREAAAQHGRCVEDQRELERSFDASRVPESFRALSSWAARYGIGDDYCRPYLLQRLTKKQRAQLVRAVDRHTTAVQAWLDTFPAGKMPAEAAAFMYLALGAEEIRDD
jgi:tetratricopeptide (TPR) repeat protein